MIVCTNKAFFACCPARLSSHHLIIYPSLLLSPSLLSFPPGGVLLKKKQGTLGWQSRYFQTQTHYLCYKLSQNADHFAGGVDIGSADSKIELLKKGTVLRITGLDADVHDPTAKRKVRTLTLKTRGGGMEWWEPLGITPGCTVEHAKRGRGTVTLVNPDESGKVRFYFYFDHMTEYSTILMLSLNDY